MSVKEGCSEGHSESRRLEWPQRRRKTNVAETKTGKHVRFHHSQEPIRPGMYPFYSSPTSSTGKSEGTLGKKAQWSDGRYMSEKYVPTGGKEVQTAELALEERWESRGKARGRSVTT